MTSFASRRLVDPEDVDVVALFEDLIVCARSTQDGAFQGIISLGLDEGLPRCLSYGLLPPPELIRRSKFFSLIQAVLLIQEGIPSPGLETRTTTELVSSRACGVGCSWRLPP